MLKIWSLTADGKVLRLAFDLFFFSMDVTIPFDETFLFGLEDAL